MIASGSPGHTSTASPRPLPTPKSTVSPVPTAKPSPTPTVQEQLNKVAIQVVDLQDRLTKVESAVTENNQKLQAAVDEVSRANDVLEEQQRQWIAALQKVGIQVSAPLPTPVADDQPSGQSTGEKVNINTAGVDELDSLPGIGKSYAERIIAYRTENGNFNRIEDIMKVAGIKDALFTKIKDLIAV
ncbi:helix-hairpin-helix domain-containing protein [Patescibacteria group bacterium]|nr:helix-hairpin-helix domain-containing protein [Patescibacteria group bacterium]